MTTIKKNAQVLTDEVEGTKMLCHTASVEFFRLNRTGSQIWDVCDGATVDAIVKHLGGVYPDEDDSRLTEAVQRFVFSLQEAGLVEVKASLSGGL